MNEITAALPSVANPRLGESQARRTLTSTWRRALGGATAIGCCMVDGRGLGAGWQGPGQG